jgi:hypothetical protein
MFRSQDNLQGATLFLAKVKFLKTFTDYFPYINLWAPCILYIGQTYRYSTE